MEQINEEKYTSSWLDVKMERKKMKVIGYDAIKINPRNVTTENAFNGLKCLLCLQKGLICVTTKSSSK